MKSVSADLDYCAIVLLLRQLVKSGRCTKDEARKIAARVAANLGACATFSI